jgi:uncharacterized protein YbcI
MLAAPRGSPVDTIEPTDTSHAGGALRSTISNAVVKTFSEFTGRGPTRARTHIVDNLVVCLLEDTLTKGERSLVADGQNEDVRFMRRRFQDGMRRMLCDSVETLTGRRVVAMMSDNHIDPELSVEVFVLDGAPGNGPADLVG